MSDPDTRRLWLSLATPRDGKVALTVSPWAPEKLDGVAVTLVVMGALPGGKPVTVDLQVPVIGATVKTSTKL